MLPDDEQASFLSIADVPHEFAAQRIGFVQIRLLSSNLWEVGVQGRDDIFRPLYVAVYNRRLLMLDV